MEPIAIPIRDVPRIAGIGLSTVYVEVKAQRLKTRKVGRRTIVAMDDLREWLASKSKEVA